MTQNANPALIIFDGEKITNSEFKRIVARFVHHLRENGIGAGDRFAYCGENQVKNYESIVTRADQAVYVAKRAGRNKVYLEQSEI